MKQFFSSLTDRVNHYIAKAFVTLVLIPIPLSYEATAAGQIGGLSPIEGALTRVQVFLTGGVGRGVVILALIICGGMWFMNRQGQHAQSLGRIALGAILIFFASSIFEVLPGNVTAGAGI